MSNEPFQLVRPDRRLLNETYALSIKYGLSIYDSVFITLALQLKIELATFDRVHKGSDDAIASALEEGKELLKKAASYIFVSKIHG
jgi:hypothetical protein